MLVQSMSVFWWRVDKALEVRLLQVMEWSRHWQEEGQDPPDTHNTENNRTHHTESHLFCFCIVLGMDGFVWSYQLS